MKLSLIILLALATMGAQGQDGTVVIPGYTEPKPLGLQFGKYAMPRDTVKVRVIDIREEYTAKFLVLAWDAYVKECWADSTRSWSVLVNDKIDSTFIEGEWQYFYDWKEVAEYVHRQPTFPGFIEWLRRK